MRESDLDATRMPPLLIDVLGIHIVQGANKLVQGVRIMARQSSFFPRWPKQPPRVQLCADHSPKLPKVCTQSDPVGVMVSHRVDLQPFKVDVVFFD